MSGITSSGVTQTLHFLTNIGNSLANLREGLFRGMKCCLRTPNHLRNTRMLVDEDAKLRSEEPLSITEMMTLRGGYNPLLNLKNSLKEVFPEKEVDESNLESVLAVIGEDNVDEFIDSYAKPLQYVINESFSGKFLMTVAKEYVAYNKFRSKDTSSRANWNFLFQKAEEYAAVYDGNESISSTHNALLDDTNSDEAWSGLIGAIDILKGLMRAFDSTSPLKFQSYALQRIAIETNHLSHYNPFIAFPLLQSR